MTAALTTSLGQAFRWGAVALLGLAYALASHLAAAASMPNLLGALVAIVPLLGLALVMAWRSPQRVLMLALFFAGCVALYAASGWLVTHYNWVFLLQHAGIYGLLCAAFGRTLQGGKTPMISHFASIVHRELSPALMSYTRSATWAWTI